MIKEKRILLAFLFVGLPLFVSAQNKQAVSELQNDWIVDASTPYLISLTPSVLEALPGTVSDTASGEPLPGENIFVKGTSTNADGEFEITVVSLQDTLVFSYIGYQTKEVPINDQTELKVNLQLQTI